MKFTLIEIFTPATRRPLSTGLFQLLSLLFLLLPFTGGLLAQNEATGYRYVRFVADDVFSGSNVREVTFLNGDIEYPRLPMKSNPGTFEAEFYGSAPYNGYLLFDQVQNPLLYIGDGADGQKEYTLEFKERPVYLTGVRISRPSWSAFYSFYVEATNDPEAGWTLIYASPRKMENSEFNTDGTFGVFNFGTTPVAIDTVAPLAPAPEIADLTPTTATISWPDVVDDQSGIAGYEIFFDGEARGFSSDPILETSNLLPGSDHDVKVIAFDTEFNASDTASFSFTTATPPAAEGYRFVRFVADNVFTGSQLKEVTFLNGEVEYPRLPMTSNPGTFEASFYGSSPYDGYRLFDNDLSQALYIGDSGDGMKEYTLEFKERPVYLTGIRISRPSWSPFYSFYVEASNDPEAGWTLIYESPRNMDNSYFGSSGTEGVFYFGTEAVSIDTEAPPAPAPLAGSITQNSITVEWPAVEDGQSEMAGYEVFFDGISQGFSESNSFLQIDLQPSTEYEVSVVAYDTEFNASESGTVTVTTSDPPVAEGYTYLRFYTYGTPNGIGQIVNIDWLMGDKAIPFEALTSATGSSSVEISSTNENIYTFDGPWKTFDDADDTHWYAAPGKEVTLHFRDVTVYPTGIAIGTYSWLWVVGFRCEGSNDGVNWTVLQEREGLTSSDFVKEGSLKVGRFDFDLELPEDLDQSPPSVPLSPEILELDATSAYLRWPASIDTGVGVAAYRLYVDGYPWQLTKDTTMQVYGFSPETTYQLEIEAIDLLGNTSARSAPLPLTTSARATARGAMAVGSGLGSYTNGIWKDNVDFAAEWADYENSNPFNPVYLEELDSYKVLRYMGMMPTNNNWLSNWSDRRLPDDASQSVRPNFNKDKVEISEGMALEWMIKLCNLTGADLWINVPHAATDDFVSQMAAVIQQYLDPSLQVYIEYSNEVWGGFAAENYANDQGFARGFDAGDFPRYAWFGDDEYARFRFYVYRSVQLFDIFNSVFGDDAARVQKVLAGWSGQPDMTRVHLDALASPEINPSGTYPDYYAIAPYFGISNGIDTNDPLDQMRELVVSTMEKVKAHYAIIGNSGHDIGLVTYEGGQHFTVGGETINRNPAMYQIYMEYLDQLAPYIDVYTNFYYAGGFGRGMAWGAKEYIGQPDILAYKYRALEDWIGINADNPPNLAPTILEQPEVVTVAEGSGVQIFPTVVGRQPIVYEWFEDGVSLTGESGPLLSVSQLGLEDTGTEYTFTATNSYGQAISQTITLLVTEQPKALVTGTSRPITVDGEAESIWNQSITYPLEKVSSGVVTDASDLSASFRTLWDENYFYVLVDVRDDVLVPVANPAQPWNYDGVEIYLDVTNDKTNAYDGNDRQVIFGFGTDGPVGVSGSMAIPNTLGALTQTADGYRAEIAFAWSDLGLSPAEGKYLGLDVVVADNDTPGGDREGKLGWWSSADLNYTRPANFGTALLAPVSSTQISIVAAGRKNTETMVLQIDGVDVQTWENVGGDARDNIFVTYHYEADQPVSASQIRVAFVNDRGASRDLRVDGILVDGVFYESEAPTTLSTGTWVKQEHCDPGFKQSEYLNCNGYFAYDQVPPATLDGSATARESHLNALEIEELLIYPNPSADDFTVRFPVSVDATELTVVDALGRTIRSRSLEAGRSSALIERSSDLAAGIYHIVVRQGDQRMTARVVLR